MPSLAECSGVPVVRFKVIIFVIACALVGLQGGLQAPYLRTIEPLTYWPARKPQHGGHERHRRHDQHRRRRCSARCSWWCCRNCCAVTCNMQRIFFGIILFVMMAFLPGGIVELWRARALACCSAAKAGVAEPWRRLLEVANALARISAACRLSMNSRFDVEQGEILGIIGPNGAGKTTAVNLVSGVIKPTCGSVMFGGRARHWPRAARAGRQGAGAHVPGDDSVDRLHRAREPAARGLSPSLSGFPGDVLRHIRGTRDACQSQHAWWTSCWPR